MSSLSWIRSIQDREKRLPGEAWKGGPIGNSPNQKYDNKYFLICLIDFLKSGFCWTRYNGTPEFPIKGKYLNQIHNKYVKNNVYEEIEKQLKNKYLKHNREPKLKIQIIDSSFIANK